MERSLVTQRTDGIHNWDTGTQREELRFKRRHSSPATAGCWLWVFETIFVAQRKVEKKNTRRERAGGNFMDRVTTVQPMLSSTPPQCLFPERLLWFWMRSGTFTHCFTHWLYESRRNRTLSWWTFSPRYLRVSGLSSRTLRSKKLFCGFLPEGCQLINSQTWRKNCGYWRTSTWCTSVRLHLAYR